MIAITKYHKLVKNNRNLFLHNTEGYKSEIKASTGIYAPSWRRSFVVSFSFRCLPTILGIPCLVDAVLQYLPLVSHRYLLPECLMFLLIRKNTSHVGLGTHSTPVWSYLNWLHVQWPYFQPKQHSEVLGTRALTYPLSRQDSTCKVFI